MHILILFLCRFQVIKGLFPGVTTYQLDELAAEQCASMTTIHPDYAILAARIGVDNLHKETKKVRSMMTTLLSILPCFTFPYFINVQTFSEVMKELNQMKNADGRPVPMVSDFHYKIIEKNADRLNSAIIYDRDFNYQYFGFKTLMRSYLLKNQEGRVSSKLGCSLCNLTLHSSINTIAI